MGAKETKKKKISGPIMSDMNSYARRQPFAASVKRSALYNKVENRIEPATQSAQMSVVAPVAPAMPAAPPANPEINFLRANDQLRAKVFAWRNNNIIGQLTSFAMTAVVLVIILQGAHIFASSQSTKSVVLGAATDDIGHLQEAAQLAGEQQFTQSQLQFGIAKQGFEQAKQNISNLGGVFNSILSLTPKGRSANQLLSAGESIALAGEDLNSFYNIVSQLHFSAQGFDGTGGFYQSLNDARAYLQKGNNNLIVADQSLDAVDPNQLPANLQGQFQNYHQQLKLAASGLSDINGLLGLAQDFLGKNQKSILVLFENNKEMRATGGFIGTYGLFKISDGRIVSQKISSIYDLDGQLKQKIAPPGPFHDLTDRWGLRDSNWFVDFRASAQKAAVFYEKEGLETPDAVVAMTPDVLVDLLKITGPIDFPKYSLNLSADNFRTLVQLNTSADNNSQDNAPKQMLADFAPLLLQRLAAMPSADYQKVFSALFDNLAQKNILFYDRDPQIEQQFENYNWTGAITTTDKDYLAVFNTNLGGRKTDLDVQQQLDVRSEAQDDGSIINTVTYTRTHNPSLLDARTKNTDYVRFLVPKGSTLISAQGFTKHPFYHSDGSDYVEQNQQFSVDPDLQILDANSVIDALSGTVITLESDKTEFANWIDTDPGQTSTVVIKYKLPFNINASKKYSLVVQKQPGNTSVDFSYSFDSLDRHYLWFTPDDLQISGALLQYKQTLKSDIFIGAVLDR